MSSRPPQSQPMASLSTPRIVSNPWVILLVLTLGFFMILLDTTVVNVAIPSISNALHASLDQILWVLNAYILVYAVLLITAGRLGDMFGPRRMFMLGMTLFVLSSAACGLSQNANELILFRVIQGVGGAMLTPQSLAMIPALFPPQKRGAAFGVWGAVAGLAAVAGPTLGGFLTTQFSWRAIFYVNLPVGIIALTLATLLMPELTIHRRHKLDIVGIVLASAGLFALVFGLIEGQRYNWGPIDTVGSFSIGSLHASIVSIPTLLLLSAILIPLFVWWEARQEEPLLPLSLFRDRNFSVGNTLSGVIAFAMFGLFLPMTIFLQAVLGLDALHAGFVFVPMTLTSTFIAPFAGRMTDRISPKWLLMFGTTLFAIGMGTVIAVASLSSSGLTFTLPLILAGVGMGCTFAPLTTAAMRDIEPGMSGAASGFLNTVRQVGGSIGSAVVGAVLQNRLALELHSEAAPIANSANPPLPPQARAQFLNGFAHATGNLQVGRGQTGLSQLPRGVPPTLGRQLHQLALQVFDHAYLLAMKPALSLSIIALAVGTGTTLFLRANPAGGRRAEQERPAGLAAVGE